ncbi:hypothetical protein Aab01nite_53170 [Paractinoplanes abujensis]|nr:hypothetical protein Aab01nite_53170 [Actinoplanes abujensis]
MGSPADVMVASAAHWLAAADRVDEFEVALALTASAGERDDLMRARLLLLTGRPREALGLLAREQITELSPESRTSWPHLLLAACRAAGGDLGAYRWLLSTVAAWPGAWQPLYLVGAAAEQCGDYATADQAWTALVRAHGIVTSFTLSRFLGSVVARRDRHDGAAATRTVLDVVEEFLAADPDVEAHPEPILAAVNYLRRRGDTAGSALLLHVAHHRFPEAAALRAVVTSAPMRRFGRRRTALRLASAAPLVPAAALAVWSGVPPLVVAGLVPVLLVHHFGARTVPGFTAADSAVWRAGAKLRQGPARRELTLDQHVGAALALALVVTAAVPIAGASTGRVTLSAVVFAGLMAVVTAIGQALMRLARWHNWRSERHRRQQADRYRLADAGDCRCWQAGALTGSYATAYLNRHLTVAGPAGRLLGAAVLRCPTTGTLWLSTTAGPSGKHLLLRGVDQLSIDQPAPATGGYL